MRIKVNRTDFLNLVFTYLLDKINNKNLLPINNNYQNEIFKKLSNLRGSLVTNYVSMDPRLKGYYKLIRKVWKENDLKSSYVIEFSDTDPEILEASTYMNQEDVKKIVKESLKKLLEQKYQTGEMLTESDIDNTIKKIINNRSL